MRLYFTLALCCICAVVSTSSAQNFEITPLTQNRKLELQNAQAINSRSALADTPRVNLPFIDDFSYTGNTPNKTLWLDRQVFVNATNSTKAPTYGFATFDGIDGSGKPYSTFLNDYGTCDTLTSTFINLSTYRENAQTAERQLLLADSVYLSFFIQPKGLCYPPIAADSMVLEFKDTTNQWTQVASFKGFATNISLDSVPPFAFVKIKISDARYFFNKFQLRFYNYGRRDGAYEQWHLDYVKIVPGGKFNTTNLDDVAFTELPPSILKQYTAMPWRHAKAQIATEVNDALSTNFSNLFAIAKNPTQTNASVSTSLGNNLTSGTTILDGINIPPSSFYRSITKNYPSTVRDNLKNTDAYANFSIYTDYSLSIEGQEARDTLRSALNNDKVRGVTNFSNYFAYDDGTAELQLTSTGENQQTAIRFHANVADTLRGVMFFFPHINGGAGTGLFNLKIWKDSLTATPLLIMKNIAPFYLDTKADTIQGFTSFGLNSPTTKADTFIVIPAGDFYIGWQNVGDVKIPIGLDRNNLSNSKYIYQEFNGAWQQIKSNTGAVMIRPVMGSKIVQSSSTLATAEPLSDWLRIYPTPAQNFLTVENISEPVADYILRLGNLSGIVQNIPTNFSTIDISNLPNGIYILQAERKTDGAVRYQKVVIAH